MGLRVVLVDELLLEFHCDLQLQDRSLTVNGMQVVLVDELPMEFHFDLQL